MTIFFPDVSEYTPVSLAGAPVALARATISTVTDTHWAANVQDAVRHNVPLLGYCFLNAGSLGVSPEAQADCTFGVVGTRPVMLDHEPNRGACATLAEACRWIDRYRSHGGMVYLHYLPHWAWQQMGSPDLQPLADRGMALVASDYTTYSDTGPGWAPYYTGCPVPVVQWQWSDNHLFNGINVDWNAFKGSIEQYLTIAGGDVPLTAQDVQTILNTPIPGTSTPDHPGDRLLVDILHDVAQRRAIDIGQVPLSTYPADAPLAKLYAATDNPAGLTDAQLDTLAQKVAALVAPAVASPAAVAAAVVDEQARRLTNG